MELTRQRVRPETNITTREENPDNLVEAPIQVIDNIASKLNAKTQKEIFVHVHPFIEAYITKGFLRALRRIGRNDLKRRSWSYLEMLSPCWNGSCWIERITRFNLNSQCKIPKCRMRHLGFFR